LLSIFHHFFCVRCLPPVLTYIDPANIIKYQEEPIDQFLNTMCAKYLPPGPAEACQYVIDNYGPLSTHTAFPLINSHQLTIIFIAVLALLRAQAGPDDLCHALGLCTNTSCRLFPKNSEFKISAKLYSQIDAYKQKASKEDPWQWISDLIKKVFQEHKPLVDIDNDSFSTLDILRGSNWRGKDCNDLNSQVRPGKKSYPSAPTVDYNCNGISGADPLTAKPYKGNSFNYL